MIVLALTVIISGVILHGILGSVFRRIRDFRRSVNAVKDLPCENRHWLFGHAHYFPANKLGLNRELDSMRSYPRCAQRWFGPLMCIVMSYHPDICKTFLSLKDGKTDAIYRFIRSWIGDGLLTSNGKKWLRNRRLLTPIFHFEALKRYLPCVNGATTEMMKKWAPQDSQFRSVEMFHDLSLMTLDNLLRCMFSKRSGCESGQNKEYLKAVKYVTHEIVRRIRNPLYHYDFIYFLTPSGRMYKQALAVLHNFTEDAIRERSEQLKLNASQTDPSKYDFLDVLLMAKDEDGRGLSHTEIRDELDTFVFEGHDTVTSGLAWAFYNLACYPDQQNRCRNEVIEVLGGKSTLEWAHLTKLQYLGKFIKESMRIHPPVLEIRKMIDRSVLFPEGFEPNKVNPHNSSAATGQLSKEFPKDTLFGLRIFMLHRNPQIWENPNHFDPSRFDPDKVDQRSSHAYLPFSAGPRNCIGQNFAMNEMKVVLALALSRFKFSIDPSYPKPEMQPSVVLRSATGIHLIVEKL